MKIRDGRWQSKPFDVDTQEELEEMFWGLVIGLPIGFVLAIALVGWVVSW